MDPWQIGFGFVTLLVAIVTAALRVQKGIRDEMRVEFAAMRAELDGRARDVTDSVEIKLSRQTTYYTDTFTAMRQQHNDEKIWVREHCVQTGPFSEILTSLRDDILRNRQETTDRFEKMDVKIDQLLNHIKT